MSAVSAQTQSSFFVKLPPEMRDKVYAEYAMEYFGNHDTDFSKRHALLDACHRFKDEAGAVISQYAARVYYPASYDPFTLLPVDSSICKPEEVKNLLVHLVCDTTFHVGFLDCWRRSFYALARKLKQLPDSNMTNVGYVQIQLHPAPNAEICQGTLLSLEKALSHEKLKLVDIFGRTRGSYDGGFSELFKQEIRRRHSIDTLSSSMGALTLDEPANGHVRYPYKEPKNMEHLVEIRRHRSVNDMIDEADKLTATSDLLEPPVKSWYMKTMDSRKRSWGFFLVQERNEYFVWEAMALSELKEKERQAKEHVDEIEGLHSDAATVGSSSCSSSPIADAATADGSAEAQADSRDDETSIDEDGSEFFSDFDDNDIYN